MDDPLPDLIANIDQAIANLPHVARLIFGYYASLIDAGFCAEDALELTIDYQRQLNA